MRRFNSSVIRLKNSAGEYEGMVALRGYNSYELAKQMGFEGTEEEWMESLIGDGWIGAFQTTDAKVQELEDSVNTFEGRLAKHYSVTLYSASWTGEGPYTQTVTIAGITANDKPHWSVVYSEDSETRLAEKEAYALVDDLETFDGSVTFTCFEEKPEISIDIQMEVNG